MLKSKNLVIAIILIVSSVQSVRSQTWSPPGATWYYSVWSSLLGYDAVVEYKYTGDTLLSGTNCKVIKGTFQGVNFYEFGSFEPHTIPNYKSYYTYENNNVVYLYNGANFDTVVNYSANVGDKWLSSGNCNPRFSYKVLETGTTTVNNTPLRTISASYTYTYSNSTNVVLDSIWVVHFEKIQGAYAGSWRGLFFSECPLTHLHSQNETPFEYFCGYRDNTTPLQMSGMGGCKIITGITENTKENKKLKLFPNPNNGNFNVELPEATVLQIFNSFGEMIGEKKFSSAGFYSINYPTLPQGIYVIKAVGKSGFMNSKLIKE